MLSISVIASSCRRFPAYVARGGGGGGTDTTEMLKENALGTFAMPRGCPSNVPRIPDVARSRRGRDDREDGDRKEEGHEG